jgi:hypothetical protein
MRTASLTVEFQVAALLGQQGGLQASKGSETSRVRSIGSRVGEMKRVYYTKEYVSRDQWILARVYL